MSLLALGLALCASPAPSAPQEVELPTELPLPVELELPHAEPEAPWAFEFDSWDRQLEEDTIVHVFQRGVFVSGDQRLRAPWVILWVDRDEQESLMSDPPKDDVDAEELRLGPNVLDATGRPVPITRTLFEAFHRSALGGVVQEVYFEGPIEYTVGADSLLQASAMYMDVVGGQGWIVDANLTILTNLRGDPIRLRAQADWMRHAADGSLRADRATVTTCTYDDPHLHITTGDLRITPFKEDDNVYLRVETSDNSLDLYDTFSIPLPGRTFVTDEQGRPVFRGLRLGNSGRFGTFLSASAPLGDLGGVGRAMNDALGGNEEEVQSDLELDASYLSNRGGLFDLQARLFVPERYFLNINLGLVSDTGRDRGIVRVPQEERGDLRTWLRTRGRFYFEEDEWLDLVYTRQSDAGVQAEFWQGDFIHYEERRSYLHYRKANGEAYLAVNVQPRTDEFRSQVEQLPEIRYDRNRVELAQVFGNPLTWSNTTRVGNLRRLEGDGVQGLYLDPLFADGLGTQEALRVSHEERIELPIGLGWGGVVMKPFTSLRMTLWDFDDATVGDTIEEVAPIAGLRAASTFWKRTQGGTFLELAPYVEYRADVGAERRGGTPAVFDQLEDPLEGRFVEGGVRGRATWDEGKNVLDVDLHGIYAEDVAEGQEEGWRPVELFTRLRTEALSMPVEVFQDLRYDFDQRDTVFSLFSLGLDPPRTCASCSASAAAATRIAPPCSSRPRSPRATPGPTSGSSRAANASRAWPTARPSPAASCAATATTSSSSCSSRTARAKAAPPSAST